MAIFNVRWFPTTVEGPFGVGTGGIFTTIVRVAQAFVFVWVIILVNVKLILPEQTGRQYSDQSVSKTDILRKGICFNRKLRLKHIPFLKKICFTDLEGILVALWTIIFLSRVKLGKSFCKLKCNYCLLGKSWEWLQIFFFAHYATLQDLKKRFRISLFPIKEVVRSCINGYCLSRSTILIYILYSHRSTEKRVNSYSLLFIRVF